jgi:hypothetical protein
MLIDNPVDTATVAASTEAALMPASNIKEFERSKKWRSGAGTSSYLNITFGVEEAREWVALVDLNLTSAGTIRIQAWTDGLGGAAQVYDQSFTPTLYSAAIQSNNYGGGSYGLGNYGSNAPISQLDARNLTILPLGASYTAKYWRITFTDTNTSFQEVARVYITTAVEFTYNISWGWRIGRVENSGFRKSLGGQRYVQERDSQLEISGDFDYLTDLERTNMLVRMFEIGSRDPIIFSVYPEATNRGLTTTMYGHFEDFSFAHANHDMNRFPFRLLEDL